MTLGDAARRAARRLLPHDRHRVHAHPGHRRAALDPGARSRACTPSSPKDEQRHILERLNAAEAFEKFLATKYVGTEALRPRGRRVGDPDPRRDPRRRPPTPGSTRRVIGMAHRGRLNVLANIVGKSYDADLQGVRGPRRPRLGAGLRRREVPPRRRPASTSARRAPTSRVELAANPSHLETVDPIVRRHGPGRRRTSIEPPGLVPGAADPDPRRRRVRRPGRGGRDAWR